MKAAKRYLITLLIGFIGAFLIVCSKDLFAQTALGSVFHILCDAFFVVGVVMTSAGLLVFSSNEGTFDIIVYGVRSFADLFRKRGLRQYETFYDYRMGRAESKMKFGFILISGLFFLAVSMVMYLLYRRYSG